MPLFRLKSPQIEIVEADKIGAGWSITDADGASRTVTDARFLSDYDAVDDSASIRRGDVIEACRVFEARKKARKAGPR